MVPSNAVISVRDLVKVYRPRSPHPVRALGGITFDVHQGEIFGLLGRNGAGKTTLLRIMTTLSHPTSGSVKILGHDVLRDPLRVREAICVVLQENAVELFLSVNDNFATYARFHSISRRECERRAGDVMELFGLTEYRNQKVIDLSGGLKRRVQVAKVFMVDRPIVFLDEATTGMDPINKRTTLDAIREQTRRGRTVFLTTHVLEEAEELCDSITIIDRGAIIASGDLPAIKSLAVSTLDVSLTFDPLTPEILQHLAQIPGMTLSHKYNTVEARLRGERLSALEQVAALGRRYPLLHLEIRSATLEDVFLELLGSQEGPRGTTQEGGR